MRLKKANCKNCYKCVRACPVKAIAIITTAASERLHRQSQKRVKGRTEGASLGPALAVGRASERRYRAGRLGRRIVTARAHYCFIVLEQ